MRDEVGPDISDDTLLRALTGTTVALITDAANIASHSAQSAFVSAAMLMARSGHRVYIISPNIPLVGPQPPLQTESLIDGLKLVGRNLLPGIEFVMSLPIERVDIAIALGDSPIHILAHRIIRLNAEPWAGVMETNGNGRPWNATAWPFGGLVAGGLAAGEAFKISIRKLLPFALNPTMTAALSAETEKIAFALAPPDTPFLHNFGNLDFISGGAITNAALYSMARIPSVMAYGRIIEPDSYDLSNLNRYLLFLRSKGGLSKAEELCALVGDGLRFSPLVKRYEFESSINPLAPTVIVGVDDIPTRWAVQRSGTNRLIVGATTHWSAMASFHEDGLGCAQCLHPVDDPDDAPIPTTACVSYWAGLLAVVYLIRCAVDKSIPTSEQQTFLTPFRPERPYRAPVPLRPNCATCQSPVLPLANPATPRPVDASA